MSSAAAHFEDDAPQDEEAEMLDPDEAAEEIVDDQDATMDSGSEDGDGPGETLEEIQLVNDSVAHFDAFNDSIYAVAQHPVNSSIVALGGSEGEDLGGLGYILDSTPPLPPVLPASYNAEPNQAVERASLEPIFKLEGHTDSINALTFTLPKGEYLVSGGLDGKIRAWRAKSTQGDSWTFVAEAQEVEEVNWISPCPHPSYPNTFAIGANDGSVWVYTIDAKVKDAPFHILQTYFLHTESCTAGAWSVDGKLLGTVSENGSLYVWDPFGEAAAAGVLQGEGGQSVFGLTALDQRFAVEGGLFSVAFSPTGSFMVVGGAGGAIKVIGLPKISGQPSASSTKSNKATKSTAGSSGIGQAGQILADLGAQTDGIETLAFSSTGLLAAGSVDGSIALYDPAHRFAVRRHIKEAHQEHAVVKVEFVKNSPWILTSVGMDGALRRWDTRGGTAVSAGMTEEWLGHRGDGEGGGILGFVQADDGSRVVTAGDDALSMVFVPCPRD